MSVLNTQGIVAAELLNKMSPIRLQITKLPFVDVILPTVIQIPDILCPMPLTTTHFVVCTSSSQKVYV